MSTQGDQRAQRCLRQVRQRLRNGHANGVVIDDLDNILEALRGGVRIEHAFAAEGQSEAVEALQARGITTSIVDRAELQAIFRVDRASRVFALAHPRRKPKLDLVRDDTRDLVVLDGVVLAGNVGAVIRSATALGACAVVLVNSSIRDPYDRRLIRASRGLIFHTPLILANLSELVDFCQRNDTAIVCADALGVMPVERLTMLPQRLALAFGSERAGCSPMLQEVSDAGVRITMNGTVDSLNVSVAAGITLHQRTHHNIVA